MPPSNLYTGTPAAFTQIYGLTKDRLLHIYEIRAALESYAARRFAERSSYLDLLELEKIHQRHDAATQSWLMDDVLRIKQEFHGFICGHSKNAEMQANITRYLTLTRALRSKVRIPDSYFDRVRHEHHEFLDAFRLHDAPAAAEIGLRHVFGTQDEVLDAYFGKAMAGRRTFTGDPA